MFWQDSCTASLRIKCRMLQRGALTKCLRLGAASAILEASCMDMENCMSASASARVFCPGAAAAVLTLVPALHTAASMMGLAAGVFEAVCAAACCNAQQMAQGLPYVAFRVDLWLTLTTHEKYQAVALAGLSGSSAELCTQSHLLFCHNPHILPMPHQVVFCLPP